MLSEPRSDVHGVCAPNTVVLLFSKYNETILNVKLSRSKESLAIMGAYLSRQHFGFWRLGLAA